MNIALKLPENLKDEIINITKKKSVLDGIKDLVKQELIRKRSKYLFMVKGFEKKYTMKFKEFEEKNRKSAMDYEIEKDYLDWDMAVTVLEDINDELKGLN